MAKQLGGLPILPLGQRNTCLDRSDARCPQQLRVFRCLRLLAQLPRLLRRCELRLRRLAQELTRSLKLARLDRGLRLLNQIACRWDFRGSARPPEPAAVCSRWRRD